IEKHPAAVTGPLPFVVELRKEKAIAMLFDLRKFAFGRAVRFWALVLAAALLATTADAQVQTASEDAEPVAAVVNGDPLYVEEINSALQATLAGRKVDAQ